MYKNKVMEEKNLTDDDMIVFAEWYRMWRGHPDVGTSTYDSFKYWKNLKNQK